MLKAFAKIGSTSKILHILTVLQSIDSKILTVGYLGGAELLLNSVTNDRVQLCITESVTTGEVGHENWRNICRLCVMEVCSTKASDTMHHLCKEALKPANFITFNVEPQDHLNSLVRSFSLLRWYGALLGIELIIPEETVVLVDAHVDGWPLELYTALQANVQCSMDFDSLLMAYKGLPARAKLTCAMAWTKAYGGLRATASMAPMLLEGDDLDHRPPHNDGSAKGEKRVERKAERERERDRDRGRKTRDEPRRRERSRSPRRDRNQDKESRRKEREYRDYKPRYAKPASNFNKSGPKFPCRMRGCKNVLHATFEECPMYHTCFTCQQKGHRRNECPQKNPQGAPAMAFFPGMPIAAMMPPPPPPPPAGLPLNK